MSVSISFKELVNLAIGSPEVGAVNFNALHCLLHGLLEHLNAGEIKRDVTKEEQDFIKPVLVGIGSGADGDSPNSIFRQLQGRMSRLESRLQHLDALPSAAQLLDQSQAQNHPVQEMWQLIQLRKKVEGNEEGVTKAITAFQELLSTFNNVKNNSFSMRAELDVLKKNTDSALSELDVLKNKVGKINLRDIEDRLRSLEEQREKTNAHADRLDSIQNKLNSFPEPTEIVQWTSLHDAVIGKGSEWAASVDSKKKNVKEILNRLGQVPSQQDALEKRIIDLENELKKQADDIANIGVPDDLLEQLKHLENDLKRLQDEDKKDKSFMKDMKGRIKQLSQSWDDLNVKTEKIAADLGKFQTFQEQINELDSRKMDKEMLHLELNTKADKRALDSKVGHAQLDTAVAEFNAVIDDMMKKLSLQDEWQKVLEKLLNTVDSKLDRSELELLRKDLDDLWGILKKHLNDGHYLDSDSAAGFRKKLFERVKCISCDRPVTMMTAPHLVTVRSLSGQTRPRPSSAMEYEYRDDPNSDRMFDLVDQTMRHCGVWQCSPTCPGKRPTKSQNLTTLYPYGDPGATNYKNIEVDVIGVDGVLYKGRLDSKNLRHSFPERDITGKKTPRPPTRNIPERARSATPHAGRHSPPIPPMPSSRPRQSVSAAPNSSFLDIQDPEMRINVVQRPGSSGEQVLSL